METRLTLEIESVMTPERYQEIRTVFEAVVSTSETERAPALDSLRERDSELARHVEKLLAVHDRRSEFLGQPTPLLDATIAIQSNGELKGTTLGPYELVEIIGQGGMGQVWRAQQVRPFTRTVALKLIKIGMDTQEVVRRFETERQILAVLDHPAIAKVFDAGSTPFGRPYFVMEYVEGVPITAYCDQRRLTVTERLKLFIKVCEGIQHAHQKAIIHRDIKPSNVMVTELDGKPVPRIIDFGVARAVSPEGSGDTALTSLGAVLGTPEYMSPEQASSTGYSLDTRADVYSLGVLLYELLVGALPRESRGLPLVEILRKIREEPAQRPSSRFKVLGMDWDTAQKRRTVPSELLQQLRGDLDIVLLKALKRNPDNRYESAAALAADITRYLHHKPILARPASVVYLTLKYVRRHYISVSAAVILLMLLFAFSIWQRVEIRRITQERDRADRVAQFMTDMFQVSDPSTSRGSQAAARDFLERSSNSIETGLANDPELRAKLMGVMGRVYLGLGMYRQSESLFRRSLDYEQQLTGKTSLNTAQAMYDLSSLLRTEGKATEAKTLDLRALAIRTRLLGPEHTETLRSMNGVAADLEREGAYGEARHLEEAVYQTDRRVLGPEHPETMAAMNNLGGLLYSEGRLKEAEVSARRAVEIQKRKLGPDHPDTLHAAHLLGAVLCDEGRYSEAETVFRDLLSTRSRVLGAGHPETLRAMKALAVPLNWMGRLAEAEALDREVVEQQAKILRADDPTLLEATSDLAHILADRRRFEEAIMLARHVLEVSTRSLGAENPKTLFWAGSLASILLQHGDLEEAQHIASRTRETQLRLLGKQHAQTASTTYTLARISASRGRTREAVDLLREAIDEGLSPSYFARIEREPCMRTLRSNSDFRNLTAGLRGRMIPAN